MLLLVLTESVPVRTRFASADARGQCLGPDRAGEAVDAVVGDAHGVLLRVEWDDRRDRPEDLFLRHAHLRSPPSEDGRHQEVAVRQRRIVGLGPAVEQLRALLLADLDVARAPCAFCCGEMIAPMSLALVERIAHLHLLRARDEPLGELVEDAALHEQARACRAVLATVGEDGRDALLDGLVQIGVVEDDVGRLAAQAPARCA